MGLTFIGDVLSLQKQDAEEVKVWWCSKGIWKNSSGM